MSDLPDVVGVVAPLEAAPGVDLSTLSSPLRGCFFLRLLSRPEEAPAAAPAFAGAAAGPAVFAIALAGALTPV